MKGPNKKIRDKIAKLANIVTPLKNGTFARYLFSYIILLLIPISVFTFMIYNYDINYFTKSIISQDMEHTKKIMNNVDQEIESLYGNVMQMSSEGIFKTSYQIEHPSGFYDIRARLKSVEASNRFIDQILFYNKSLGRIYTSNAIYTFDDFYKYGSTYENYTKEEFRRVLNSIGRKYKWIPQQSVYYNKTMNSSITYIIPMNWSSINTYSMILYHINADHLNDLIGGGRSHAGDVLITTDNDLILFHSGKNLSPEIAGLLIKRAHKKDHIAAIIKSKKYLVSCVPSDSTGLTYYSITLMDVALSEVRRLTMIFLSGTLFIILISMFAIKVFMHFNYDPVRQLSGIAKSVFPASSGDRDDILVAQNALIHLSDDNAKAEKEKHELMQEKLLLRLLSGGMENIEAFNALGAKVGLSFTGTCFCVMIFRSDSGCQEGNVEYISYEPIVKDELSGFETYMMTYYKELILIASGSDFDSCLLREKSEQIVKDLETDFHIHFTAGIGNVYHDISSVCKSYFEADIAVKSGEGKRDRCVVLFYELLNPADGIKYPEEELDTLYSAIRSGDTEKINWLMNVFVQIANVANNDTLKICLFKDIITISDKALQDWNSKPLKIKEKYSGILYHPKLDIGRIPQFITNLSRDLIDSINENKDPMDSNMDKILTYINRHYMDNDFSVNKLSDTFEMSISNFSHYFKSRMDQTVSDYINSIRFEKAKELLRNTPLSIQEIANQIGYVQASGFMRKFKSMEGLTPGSYRKKFADRSPDYERKTEAGVYL